MQGSNGDIDIEKRLMGIDEGGGRGADGMNGESSVDAYTLPYIK